jgi:hypothetical protein
VLTVPVLFYKETDFIVIKSGTTYIGNHYEPVPSDFSKAAP